MSLQIAARCSIGQGLSEDEWERLKSRGLSGEDRAAVEAALADGDGEGAAAALDKAMADLPEVPPGSGESLAAWGGYETALRSPNWSPRFDRVVQEYFRRSAEEGLR